jgi:hypothetical protein
MVNVGRSVQSNSEGRVQLPLDADQVANETLHVQVPHRVAVPLGLSQFRQDGVEGHHRPSVTLGRGDPGLSPGCQPWWARGLGGLKDA